MTTSRFGRINRRRLVASTVVGGAALMTAEHLVQAGPDASQRVVSLAQDGGGSVPMFRGNAARTGEMPGPGPDGSLGLESIWTFKTANASSISPPSVMGEIAYFGCSDGNMYAMTNADGTEIWRYATSASADVTPAVVEGMVFIVDGSDLCALNATDGSEHWRFATGDPIFPSSPAVVDGVVYIGNDDGGVYAINSADGSEIWRSSNGAWFSSSPAVADGIVCIGSHGGDLFAIDAEDGTERWRFSTGAGGEQSLSTPAIADSVVYVTGLTDKGEGEGTLYSLNLVDGTERWRFAGGRRISADMAVADGTIYVGNRDGDLYALNTDDGTEVWSFSTGGGVVSGVTLVADTVYVGSDEIHTGTLFAVSTVDGSERWRWQASEIIDSLVVTESTIYFGRHQLNAIVARVPRLSVGGTARVTENTSLRGGPASTAVERAELKENTLVTITGESVATGDIAWWPVTVNDTGDQGWVEASKLEPLTSG